jgi:putative ABC transport system substrate-binding protein
MRRREFIAGLGSLAAWPVTARAQQGERVRHVGWLDSTDENDPEVPARVTTFQQGMEKLGWFLGRNLAIDYRWRAFDLERARLAAAELLQLRPDVIVCTGTPATLALQQATRTVPIVFVAVSEPVAQGMVQSLAHPGGNLTGFSWTEPTIGGKWLNLLKEIAPSVDHVALMFNPMSSPYSRLFYPSIEAAALQAAATTEIALVHETRDIEPLMSMLARQPGGGLIVSGEQFNLVNRKLIIELAARYRLPAIYGITPAATDGALIQYSVDGIESLRSAVAYVDRILRGEKPADLPVQQPTKFLLVVNAKTATALGLTIPETLLATADEVIQ